MYHRFEYNLIEMFKRTFKYLIITLTVAFAANNIPKQKLDPKEILLISIVAGCVFAIIDMFAPSVSNTTVVTVNKNENK